ncbi:UBX domain-containing protein 1 [Pseudocercospora fuligena]|uniref:UBX domain-containing protein 1 n=1 Tax=Pseudocercospora fuligena TaxID=685502 RepID=A0A8H6RJD8_9PEZI|nr:UBX domain-containing protein 1 [Pseudocercospora fuligena]
MDSDQSDKIAQFSAVTGANPSAAQTALNAANWDLEQAVGLFFAANEEPAPQEGDEEDAAPTPATQPTSAQPAPSTSSRTARGGGNASRMRTLRDLQSGGDDDDEKDENQDMFAGGEKSGLAVQNPGEGNQPIDHFRNIMNQARQNRDRPPGEGDEQEQPRSANFSGRAQTLGGDEAPSRVVEDPEAASRSQRRTLPRVTRTLHLWADGVSIDDGPLLRFDDPANQNIMSEINQGRAPKALLDVEPDQEVDLNLDPHKGENYVAPKPKYKPFGGSGQRLGSPTPGIASSSTPAAAPSSSGTAASASTKAPENTVDESQPTLQMQIRLGDGTRLSSRFNTTQTIGDVYDFVTAAQPNARPWVLQTTFPPQELTDKTKVLGEMSDFKRGGVVVQKWK